MHLVLHEFDASVPVFLVAFSAGTNILRKLLIRIHDRIGPGEEGRHWIAGAMSVCIAGEDYLHARDYLEGFRSTHVDSALSLYPAFGVKLFRAVREWYHVYEGMLYSMLMTYLYKVRVSRPRQ